MKAFRAAGYGLQSILFVAGIVGVVSGNLTLALSGIGSAFALAVWLTIAPSSP